MTPVDFTPLANVLLDLAATAATVVGTWALSKLAKVAHVTLSQQNAKILETAMQSGINFALSKAEEYAKANAGAVPIKSDVVATAVNYVLPKVPDALAKLGVTKEGLAQRIEARLPLEANTGITYGTSGSGS